MKITHLCLANFYSEGFAYQENLLPKYHKKMGFEVEVIASQQSFNTKGKLCFMDFSGSYLNSDGIKVYRLENASPKFVYKKMNRYVGTYKALCESNPDILFIHGLQFLDMDKVIKYLRKHQNVKVYVDNHADFVNSATNFVSKNILHKIIWKNIARKIQPFCQKFYGVLPARVAFLYDVYGLPMNMLELLVMGADDEQIDKISAQDSSLKEELGIPSGSFVICTGGKIDAKKKEILNLIDAINAINENVVLVVFGSISNDMKDVFYEKVNSSQKIKYIGWIDSSSIYQYYMMSDLVVYPATHSVLWEQAVGYGVPCIFRRWKGIDHLDLGGNCIYIDNGDETELITVISKILNDKEFYRNMLSVARCEKRKKFTYSEIARKSVEEEAT